MWHRNSGIQPLCATRIDQLYFRSQVQGTLRETPCWQWMSTDPSCHGSQQSAWNTGSLGNLAMFFALPSIFLSNSDQIGFAGGIGGITANPIHLDAHTSRIRAFSKKAQLALTSSARLISTTFQAIKQNLSTLSLNKPPYQKATPLPIADVHQSAVAEVPWVRSLPVVSVAIWYQISITAKSEPIPLPNLKAKASGQQLQYSLVTTTPRNVTARFLLRCHPWRLCSIPSAWWRPATI